MRSRRSVSFLLLNCNLSVLLSAPRALALRKVSSRLSASGLLQLPPKTSVLFWEILGNCCFYQRFVQNYSTLVAPLTDLLKKEVEWIWSTPQEQSFQKLKAALCQASTLAYPDVSRTFVVHLDASNVAMGATLSQEDASGKLCLLNCASRKFNSAERNYPPTSGK